MNYDDLGTTNNYPTGTIVTPETVVCPRPQGNSTYVVETEVDYSEDVTDPSLGASKDIRITVSWTTPRPGSVTVESNIAGAPAVTNAGAVEILVQDSDTSDPGRRSGHHHQARGRVLGLEDDRLRWLCQVEAGRDRIHRHHRHVLDALPRHERLSRPPSSTTRRLSRRPFRGSAPAVARSTSSTRMATTCLAWQSRSRAPWDTPTGVVRPLQEVPSSPMLTATWSSLCCAKATTPSPACLSGYAVQASPPGLDRDCRRRRVHEHTQDGPEDHPQGHRGGCQQQPGPGRDGVPRPVPVPSRSHRSPTPMAWRRATTWARSAPARPTRSPPRRPATSRPSGSVTMDQFSQGTITLALTPQPPTTIKVTVRDASNNPIPGVTLSATGPSGVTFASVTDASGQATSNDMGAIGSGKTYTVTASKSGWTSNTGTVTLSQYTQGTRDDHACRRRRSTAPCRPPTPQA